MTEPPGDPGLPSESADVDDRLLRVLAIDDEPPALADLAWLLGQHPGVGTVRIANDGAEALRLLQDESFDAVFLDIRMPSLDGLDLARILARFTDPPRVVFVTAYEDYAVKAFELRAVDYVLKPIRVERLAEAIRRVIADSGQPGAAPGSPDETLAVELGGVTRFVRRSQVTYVEAHGDYARLHTSTGSHLVRLSLAALEERWAPAGFVRVHRRYLVATREIAELRNEGGRSSVRLVGGIELPVARRHSRDVRRRLVELGQLEAGG